MNIFKKIVVGIALGSALLCCANIALADTDTSGSDISQGTIDWVDLNHNQIVIDDRQYTLAHDVVIHSSTGLVNRQALSQGKKVRFDYMPHRTTPVVKQIWLSGSR